MFLSRPFKPVSLHCCMYKTWIYIWLCRLQSLKCWCCRRSLKIITEIWEDTLTHCWIFQELSFRSINLCTYAAASS